jgi:hypothetical protein
MQLLFYAMATCIFCIDWLAEKLHILPDSATYFPELFAVIFSLAIVFSIAQRRRIDIDSRVAVILVLFVLVILSSAIVNNLSPGVLINGIRLNLKFLPFFVLPLVYQFSEAQIRRQLAFVLTLTLVQMPVALYQRFVKYASDPSGDPVGGTLGANTSGILSIWLACVIAVVVSFYLTKMMRLRTLVVLLALLIAPMTINETKISFFLIPLALIVPAVLSNREGSRWARLVMTTGATFMLFIILVIVYDSLRPANRADILDWFTSDDAAEYVYLGSETGGKRKDVKRLDSIRIAYKKLQYENAIIFGLGPGNISPAFDRNFEGEYFRRYDHLNPQKTQISLSLWETGTSGTLLTVSLMLACGLVAFKFMLRNHGDQYEALALGWLGVTTILCLCLFYESVLAIDIFAIFYWFYSGVIVAKYTTIGSSQSPA